MGKKHGVIHTTVGTAGTNNEECIRSQEPNNQKQTIKYGRDQGAADDTPRPGESMVRLLLAGAVV